jgi:hypothetical protein
MRPADQAIREHAEIKIMILSFNQFKFAAPLTVVYVVILLAVLSSAGASTVQLASIDFKSGHPNPKESIVQATSYTEETLNEVLETNARALKEIPQLGAEITGFSDERECAGRDCDELSLRRAALVYQWLIEHGVPVSKLRGPSVGDRTFKLDNNDTERGRQLNRRVQFDLFSIK